MVFKLQDSFGAQQWPGTMPLDYFNTSGIVHAYVSQKRKIEMGQG